MGRSRDDWIGGLFGMVVVVPVVFSIATAAVVLCWQCLEWLRWAEWPMVTLRDAMNWFAGHTTTGPTSRWVGLDRIIGWLVEEAPLVLWLVVLPVIWLSAGIWYFNQIISALAARRSPGE
jgi:hypothetical protein